jgi:hypothetical protein
MKSNIVLLTKDQLKNFCSPTNISEGLHGMPAEISYMLYHICYMLYVICYMLYVI